MADYGLLQGLAEGLKSGIGSYKEEKRYQDEQSLKKRQNKLLMLKEGVQEDPNDPNNLTFEPGIQAKKDYEAAIYDPNSAASQSARTQTQGLLTGAGVNSGLIPDTATAKDLSGESSLYGKAISGAYSAKGREMSNQRMNDSIGLRRESLDFREGQAAGAAGQAIEHDPIVQGIKKTTNNLDRASSMMSGDQPITAKNFAILQQDMINAMAPGGAATEGKVNREMIETFAGRLNDLQLKFGNVQDLRKEQPQVFAQLAGLIKNIRHDYGQALTQQVQDLSGSYDYTNNPLTQKTLAQKKQRYAAEPSGLMNTTPKPDDNKKQQAMDFIVKNPDDPRIPAMKKALGIK